jgi:hypothetical protein
MHANPSVIQSQPHTPSYTSRESKRDERVAGRYPRRHATRKLRRPSPNYPSSRSQPSASSGPLVGFSFFLHVGLLFLRCLLRPPCTVNVRECGGPGSRDSPTPRRTRRQEKTKKKRKKITRRTCTASITYRGAIGVCTYVPSVSCHLPDGMS